MPLQKFSTGGLRAFFERFQTLSAASDTDGLAAMYATNVMVAGPNGTQVVTSEDLLRAIPKRKQLFESAGYRETELVGFEEAPLTNRYSLVRAEWRWQFQPIEGQPLSVTLPSTFIVDGAGDAPHIVLYMNQQDIGGVLRERGLLPSTR
jgi:Domain of unknown function (DUF4440)